ncbi:unnamed protein product, partial [Mesorhabditis spiculigera]
MNEVIARARSGAQPAPVAPVAPVAAAPPPPRAQSPPAYARPSYEPAYTRGPAVSAPAPKAVSQPQATTAHRFQQEDQPNFRRDLPSYQASSGAPHTKNVYNQENSGSYPPQQPQYNQHYEAAPRAPLLSVPPATNTTMDRNGSAASDGPPQIGGYFAERAPSNAKVETPSPFGSPPQAPISNGRGLLKPPGGDYQQPPRDPFPPLYRGSSGDVKPNNPDRESNRAPPIPPTQPFAGESWKRPEHETAAAMPPLANGPNGAGDAPFPWANRFEGAPPPSSTAFNASRPHFPEMPPHHGAPTMPPNFPPVAAAPQMPPNMIPPPAGPQYIELTRLPNEMHKPIALEEWIRPSVPFKLSSVKVVYDPNGIHLHSIVRIEGFRDAQELLSRNNELGIKIRRTTAKAFDEAIDGMPPGGGTMPMNMLPSPPRRRSRSPRRRRSRSPRRDGGGRNRQGRRGRRRSRSRSPRNQRSRSVRRHRRMNSRTPTPCRPHPEDDPNRFMLQANNMPFKCKDFEFKDWVGARCKFAKRTAFEDGNASDRWILEFHSATEREQAMQKDKQPFLGRRIRFKWIGSKEADGYLQIPDRFGEQKTIEYNIKAAIDGTVDTDPGRFGAFSAPSLTTGAPPFVRGNFPPGPPGPHPPGFGQGPTPFFNNGGHPPMMDMDMGFRGGHGGPGRGMPRGRGSFGPPPGARGGFRGPMPGRPFDEPPMGGPPMLRNDVAERGRNGFRGGIGRPGPNGPHHGHGDRQVAKVEVDGSLASALGPCGSVLLSRGFDNDVCLEDVIGFFDGYPLDHSTIRIRMDERGMPTGDCMLAMRDPEAAHSAALTLDGKRFKRNPISVALAMF